jgi:hypothetical protein
MSIPALMADKMQKRLFDPGGSQSLSSAAQSEITKPCSRAYIILMVQQLHLSNHTKNMKEASERVKD